MKDFRITFENSHLITENYSQAGQDLFAIICLNGKKNGKFLDLGCHHPTLGGNNTYLLEKEFEWDGLSYDIDESVISEFSKYRQSLAYCQDCTRLDWDHVLNFSNHFDYLSLDLEPAAVTYQCLENIPFDKIEFSVITYEHDFYRFGNEYKDKAYNLLIEKGYVRVCENVKHNGNIFEDWFINPKYINLNTLNNLKYYSDKEYSEIIFLNTQKYNYTLVSALIPDLNEYRLVDKYKELGKDLLSLDIPKIIFMPEYLHDWAWTHCDQRNTQLIKFEKEELMYDYIEKYKHEITLPQGSWDKKDTFEYFLCQNFKSFWLKKAYESNLFNNQNYVWIDFGIKHIFKDNCFLFRNSFEYQLELNNKIKYPSCFNKNFQSNEIKYSIDNVEWYFTGGILALPDNQIVNFDNLCQEKLKELITIHKKITWEVNIWAAVLKENLELFTHYYSNHDNNIVKNLFLTEKYYENCINARIKGKNTEALQYYELARKNENYFQLNQEKLDYEMTILHYYCFPHQKVEGLKFLINYLNQFKLHESNVWNNLKYYIQSLRKNTASVKRLESLDLEGYINSSPCKLITKNGKEYVNIRNVNYSIKKEDGHYYYYNTNRHMSWENTLKHPVHTINVCNNQKLEEINLTSYAKIQNSTIKGLEDIRLFERNNQIMFLATTRDFSNHNLICTGQYLPEKQQILIERIFNSPENSNCEKNWTLLNENEIIYKWHPLTIYSFETLEKIREIQTPTFFKHFRGGSNPIQIGEFKYCVVHTVHYENPRKYLHLIVKLNHEGYPLTYSVPFDFEGERIEYCLSMNYLENGNLEFYYSTWDSSSKSLEIPFKYFNDKFIEV